jgi:SHS2 domain-containing protein
MFKYNILTEEVKSDFAFEVMADSLIELFRGAGVAMMEAMIDIKQLNADKVWEFNLESETLELLLFDFLGELVFVKDVEAALFNDYEITIKENETFTLSCKAFGSDIDYEKYEILTDVKAVTMHKFVLEERNKEWYCHVIVDL